VGTPFPLLKCLRTHYGPHCEPVSGPGPKCSRLKDFAYTVSLFSERNTPGLSQKRPRCYRVWTQTPISAWLASVPIVPVLRPLTVRLY